MRNSESSTYNAALHTTLKIKNMKKILMIASTMVLMAGVFAQDNMHPAEAYKGRLVITNGTVHTGTGQVLVNTNVEINNGKIEKLSTGTVANQAGTITVDATGKHVYPGLILANTTIGLREIGSQVKGSNDFREIGDLNANIKSIVAYNADSKILNTLRSNGILLAHVVPQGMLITGTSSVVQFDAWNWEDAVYKMDNGIHVEMPSLFVRPQGNRDETPLPNRPDPLKQAMENIDKIKLFFREAKGYLAMKEKPATTNLKFEAVKGLYNKSQRLFVHCDRVKEMLVAADFTKEFGFDVTIVGGSESFQIAPLLKQANISVILSEMHSLPTLDDDDIDQPFKTPSVLQKAGVLFAITDENGTTTGRNLPFNAGTAASYGLSKEEALAAITLNAAKILGIDDRTGSIEAGKDANIIISTGDILDMRTSVITNAFIQGRTINLDDKHKQLNKRYSDRYGVK